MYVSQEGQDKKKSHQWCVSRVSLILLHTVCMQTCHFDLTQNLNECEKKSEYTEKNLKIDYQISTLI